MRWCEHPRGCSTGEVYTLPTTMTAALLMGHGGTDMIEIHHDVPVPQPGPNEVLIKVSAAGVNNTDINTRTGWYSKSVTAATGEGVAASDDDASWSGAALLFPLIQGADTCGRIVAVGDGVDPARIGERVIVATMQRAPAGDQPYVTVTLGSELSGSFAQYMVAHSAETHAVNCNWTDVELASIPCAYSTAENMLERVGVATGERVLITGASGGVGSAAIQLARRRGAEVVAVSTAAKADALRSLGAAKVVDRGDVLVDVLGAGSVDVVVDLVAGPQWGQLLDVLRLGGRYIASGAIAGPIVELDIRTLYLRDLTLMGATYQQPGVFENLVSYIEQGEISPLVHRVYPLADIAQAQADFAAKNFVGKLVLTIGHTAADA